MMAGKRLIPELIRLFLLVAGLALFVASFSLTLPLSLVLGQQIRGAIYGASIILLTLWIYSAYNEKYGVVSVILALTGAVVVWLDGTPHHGFKIVLITITLVVGDLLLYRHKKTVGVLYLPSLVGGFIMISHLLLLQAQFGLGVHDSAYLAVGTILIAPPSAIHMAICVRSRARRQSV